MKKIDLKNIKFQEIILRKKLDKKGKNEIAGLIYWLDTYYHERFKEWLSFENLERIYEDYKKEENKND